LILLFKTNGRGQVNHVGMVVEANDGDINLIQFLSSGALFHQ
jgi:hypothetical protein